MDSTFVTVRVPPVLVDLLREVFEKRALELLPMLQAGSNALVREDQKSCIQELVGDELVETGLGENDEPNNRGLALEALIDVFSPYK